MKQTTRPIQKSKSGTHHPGYSPYLYAMIILGLGVLAYSILRVFYLDIGLQWLILALITVLTSSHSIKIPSINAKISIGDTLYFTNVLLFGVPAGVITAALDGLAGSLRSQTRTRRLRYMLFNVAAMACSAHLAGSLFFKISGIGPLFGGFGGSFIDLLIPLSILGFSHYLFNSGSVAIIVALEKRQSLFFIWKDGFLWTSITYFAGVAAASFIALTFGDVTPKVLGVAIPVLLAVYFTYKTYLKKVDEVRSLALYDSLTGLPNRVLFKEQLEESLTMSEQEKHMLAVMFLDLDHFKRINDTYGHGIGDLLLRSVASRLKASVRGNPNSRYRSTEDQDIVIGRFGGDEFTILMKNIVHPEDATRVAQRLLKSLSNPCSLEGQEIDMSATIGISVYPFDGIDSDTLLRNADTALYHAKDNGRNSYNLYSQSMNDKSYEKLSMESQLRRALSKKEFEIHYQPKLDIHSGRISGAEALLRWNHPTRGLLDAGHFISLAEETGLIRPIGEWVLKTVCSQISTWLKHDMKAVPIAVNLSPLQFKQANLVSHVAKILEQTSLDPAFLEIELTESAIMESEQRAEEALSQLRELGIKVSVDDFGTGYSSLSRLKSFKLDALKIDRAFVKDCVRNSDDKAIITAIIAMAHSLDLNVVAEGVESDEQLAFLCEKGCNEIQGLYFCTPIAADELSTLLNTHNGFLPLMKEKGLPFASKLYSVPAVGHPAEFTPNDLDSSERRALVRMAH